MLLGDRVEDAFTVNRSELAQHDVAARLQVPRPHIPIATECADPLVLFDKRQITVFSESNQGHCTFRCVPCEVDRFEELPREVSSTGFCSDTPVQPLQVSWFSGSFGPNRPLQTRSRSIEAARDFPFGTDNLLGDGFPSCALLSESPSHCPNAARYYTPLGPILELRATPAETDVFTEANMRNGVCRARPHLLTDPRLRQTPASRQFLAIDELISSQRLEGFCGIVTELVAILHIPFH